MEHVLVTICGRAGSKGFKNKNLKIFDGLPLSHYSLAAAKLFERQNPQLSVDICLNTDSELLINTVVEKYPEVSVLRRPQELCGDVVPKMMVYQHSLREMERRTGQRYAHLIDLDITSPLRQEQDVSGAYAEKLRRPELDLVFSVCPPHALFQHGKAGGRACQARHRPSLHRAPADAACVRFERIHLCV